MDCGADYIEMCEKAKEIQAQVEIKRTGDFYFHELTYRELGGYIGGTFIEAESCHGQSTMYENYYKKSIRWVWLPRQDQLQCMMRFKYPINCGIQIGLYLREIDVIDYKEMWEWSMEQLCLAFVMKKKYNKIWSGKNWIKED